MSKRCPSTRFLMLSAAPCLTLLMASQVMAQTIGRPPGERPSIGRSGTLLPMYTAALEASFDFGDLGPDWRKQLSLYGDETLLFRWKTHAAAASKGRWQVSTVNNVPLAEGEVAAATTPGNYAQFSLNFAALGVSPPLRVRIQALTDTGAEVGMVSSAVILNQAVQTGFGTCFTDGSLGLPIADKLEAIRSAHGVPALGGAVVTRHGLEVFDAVGVRRIEANAADQVSVTKHDKWHLGSDTKAMTAMLVGILRQHYPSVVGWETTVADAFPEWAGTMNPTLAQTTLRQLLANRSGLYKFTEEQYAKLWQANVSVTQQRRNFTHAVVHDPYLIAPGVLYSYQNGNFIIAGAMLENLFQQSWEDLMTQYLFQPLGMASAGFGSPAAGRTSQPWGHYDKDGVYAPTLADNPPSYGPAGTVHASLADWAKFIRLYLNGHEGSVTLTPATRTELMTAYTSSDPWFIVWPQSYGWGWGISPSGDKVLAHDGSNNLWYARAVVFVDQGYALLVVTNAGSLGDVNHGMNAVNDATVMLQEYHAGCPVYSPPRRGGVSRGVRR